MLRFQLRIHLMSMTYAQAFSKLSHLVLYVHVNTRVNQQHLRHEVSNHARIKHCPHKSRVSFLENRKIITSTELTMQGRERCNSIFKVVLAHNTGENPVTSQRNDQCTNTQHHYLTLFVKFNSTPGCSIRIFVISML